MDYRKYITIEPGKRGGKPCVRGMRITVYEVLDYLASGMTEAEILADFPDLTSEDIRACLAFAADRERKLVTVPREATPGPESISAIVTGPGVPVPRFVSRKAHRAARRR